MWSGGNQWSGWVSYLSFFDRVVGLKLPEYKAFRFYEAAARHSGPRLMHSKFWIATDFPIVLMRDAANRPHNTDGPFCSWKDGISLYSVHGVSVPAAWIEDKATLAPETALTWRNIEQRRAAAEIIGWRKVIDKLQPKILDVDNDPEIGVLLQVDLPASPKSKFLRVLCGTKREFVLPVPVEMKTARQANAWTYGLDNPNDYQPEVRT